MNFDYIRDHYNIPIKSGMRVEVNGKMGVIKSATHHIKVLFDGDKLPRSCHPTWKVKYFDDNGNCIKDTNLENK